MGGKPACICLCRGALRNRQAPSFLAKCQVSGTAPSLIASVMHAKPYLFLPRLRPPDFQLDHLPPSVRRLRLRYDIQSRKLSVPRLPDHVTWCADLGILCINPAWQHKGA